MKQLCLIAAGLIFSITVLAQTPSVETFESSATLSSESLLPLAPNGKLLSVEEFEVDFVAPQLPEVITTCGTPSAHVRETGERDASCPHVVPCDDPLNRDLASYTSIKRLVLKWHVIMNGGSSSNITQAQIDDLMVELNSDFAASNFVFCADAATFIEDPTNYVHDQFSDELTLKSTYGQSTDEVINVYVVGTMGTHGYARHPFDPNGGTSASGGIVLNREYCGPGTRTLTHEMGHILGLEHTFAGVSEKPNCSNCSEKVRSVNGSSNTTGVATPLGGPYSHEGDREGDWCSDTNPHAANTHNCTNYFGIAESCDNFSKNNPPVNNHMSLSYCSTQFSGQQTRRMHCMADSYLGSWLTYGSSFCGGNVVADFIASPTTWQAPAQVNFTDASDSPSLLQSWTWVFDVGTSATVTCSGCTGANATYVGQNPPPVTYPNPGLYTVSLTVGNGTSTDAEVKVDHILVNAPSGDCDTLIAQWENVGPTVTPYGFGGGWITGIPDPVNLVLPTDGKGVYERYFTPNPGTTEVGAVRVELGNLFDPNDDTRFQVSVYDDDGTGAPGALIGAQGNISPTQLGVPPFGQFDTFWIPFENPPVPTTGAFHVGVEIFAGDAADTLVVATSCLGPPGCPIAEGEADASNHIFSSGFGYENLLTVYGADFDVHIVPMLGGWAPEPVLHGISETVVCDTTFVTISDSVLYSLPAGVSYVFSDGSVINASTFPSSINRVYTAPGPDTVTVYAVNDCGRSDTVVWEIPYTFQSSPSAEFTVAPANPVCLADQPVVFTADSSGYDDYFWDFGDGTTSSTGATSVTAHFYATHGTYYGSLSVTEGSCTSSQLLNDLVEIVDCSVIPPTAAIGVSNVTGCNPQLVTFSDASTWVNPPTSWLWNFGDGTFSTAQHPMHAFNAGSHFVTYEVCNSGGCTTDTMTIVVSGQPSFDSISVARCYEYTVPSGNATYSATGVYNDTLVNTAGCDSIVTIDLFIGETPSITHFTGRGVDRFRVRWEYLHPVTVNDTNFRIRAWESGFPLAFTDKSQYPGNYQKKFTGLDDNTWYKTKVGFACADGSFIWGGTDSVRTKKIPCPEVTGLMQQLPLAEQTATLTWNDNGADSYKLRFYPQSGGSYSFRTVIGTSKTLAGLSPNTFYEIQVKAQCSNGLESSYGEPYTFSTSGPAPERLGLPNWGTNVNLYPNPTSGILNLYIPSPVGASVWVELVDVTGRTIRNEVLPLKNGDITFSMDLASLKNGLYSLRVVNGDSISTHKVVKE